MTGMDTNDIAIIGMAGRFPGARNIDEFWQNLCNGVESITFFSDQEALASGVPPEMLHNPNYVKAHGTLEDIDLFDAAFFGFSPREAETLDPQQRFFLECAWQALENASYTTEIYKGRIGVYAGATMSSYLKFLLANPDLMATVGFNQIIQGNDKDYVSTRVSYKLNLRGPSITIQTTCSTSLVAVHLACQSLLSGESDMALAGGVSIIVPQTIGYLYQEGSIRSPDGHCRAFDANAQGMVGGSGVAIVVLKRLSDALDDGDYIHALIKGSAVNNDGAAKIGYTAPSIDGQAEVITEALAVAAIHPETITYVETHGTATQLGDPIEIAALNQAFRSRTRKNNFCAIGSVKTNIGHLDTVAGAAGLIKTVLALKHRMLPPSLHFETPNPKIDFRNSPFSVNHTLTEWKADTFPRRAGVSSFGIGGTNAHLILEEAPARERSSTPRSWHLLVLSAKTSSALEENTNNLAEYLKQHPQSHLADAAYTLQIGRRAFNHRRIAVCQNNADAMTTLEARAPQRLFSSIQETRNRPVVFMFPGMGSQYVNMGLELYQQEAVFREIIDRCSEHLKPLLGVDLRMVLYPQEEQQSRAILQIGQPAFAMPALFVTAYALAKLWMSWGIRPHALIGHSLGEYVAACLAGVFSLEDALALVAMRGQLIQQLPEGAMLNVPLPQETIRPLLRNSLALAAVNGPSLCVVAGKRDEIEELSTVLTKKGIECHLLHTSHAFHSSMMDPIVRTLEQFVSGIRLKVPTIPYLSNLTGTWITNQDATNSGYWGRHLRETVRFSEGIQTLLQEPDRIFLEVGPGHTLSILTRQHLDLQHKQSVYSSLRSTRDQPSELASLLTTVGQLWLTGMQIDWASFSSHQQRIPLPTYPFERQRYWVKSVPPANNPQEFQLENQFHTPSWQRAEIPDLPEPIEQKAVEEKGELTATHLRPELTTPYVAPGNEIERIIASLWRELLGIDRLGIHDDFFELGGHSLMAAQLITRLRDVFLVEIPLQSIFEKPTIAGLAEVAEDLFVAHLEQLTDEEAERFTATVFHDE